MKTSSTFNLKATVLCLFVCLVTLTAGCNTAQPTSSLAPQPAAPQEQALVPEKPSSQPVWDVRDDEVVWGTTEGLGVQIDESVTESEAGIAPESDEQEAEIVSTYSDVATSSSGDEESVTSDIDSTVRPQQALSPSPARSAPPVISGSSEDASSHITSESFNSSSPVTSSSASRETLPSETMAAPVAENGSYYGEMSPNTGRPKTVHVDGYYRKDGTYVRGHYRSSPRRRN